MDDEALYRQHHLRADARRSSVLVVCNILANIAFLSNDFRLVPPGLGRDLLLADRGLNSVASAVACGLLLRARTARTHDRSVALFLSTFVFTWVHSAASRPPGFTGFANPGVLAVNAFFFVLAGPASWRAAAGVMVSASSIFFVLRGTAGAAEKTTIVLTHALSHLIGLPALRMIEKSRREGFFAALAEQRARASLAEQAKDLAIARDRAQALARAKSDFLAMMSHELRTPMNAVLGLSDTLAGTELTSAQRQLVRSIHGAARSLFDVVADVLHLADIDAPRDADPEARFAVREIVESAAEIVRQTEARAGATIGVAIGAEVPEGLAGDAVRLRQTLVHLLGAAVAGAPVGAVSVRVSARSIGGGEHEVTFAVQGTGAGLTLRAREAEPPRRSSDRASPAPLANRDLRVLVVDDNALNREVALALLGRLGIEADVAESGREALTAALAKRHDVVLMDLRMPEMDGIEATRRLFAALPEEARPRVIAVSATLIAADVAACRAAGITGFLHKPLEISDLRAALEPSPSAAAQPEARLESTPSPSAPPASDRRSSAPSPPAAPRSAPGEPLARPVLDRAAIDALKDLDAAGDAGFFARVCRKLVSDADVRLTRLSKAIAEGDMETVERDAHTLKSASATVGAREMSAACAELEAAARRKDLAAHAGAAAALRAQLALVEEALLKEVGAPLRD
jgi:CheY-like chemotaxis protein/HPt (histidine-containing phosphotransfer) domain-containing protein